MGGLFQSKTTEKSTISPAQEESIRQRTAIEKALSGGLLNELGFTQQNKVNPAAGAGFGKGMIGRITKALGEKIGGGTEFVKTSGGLGEILKELFQLSEGEKDLAGVVGESGESLATLLRDALPGLTGKLDTSGFTNPLFERFQEEVLPGIRTRALQFGVPSGTREGEVTEQAVGRFGGAVGDALSRAELGRRQVAGGVLSSFAPQIFDFETAGARTEADTGALARALGVQGATAGFDLLQSALSGTPRPQFKPPDVTTRGRPSMFEVGLGLAGAGADLKTAGVF